MIDTVLFDYDGTLFQANQEKFMKIYFKTLCAKVEPLGYDEEEFVKAVGIGIKAMLGNDGNQTNYQRFWQGFVSVLGEDSRCIEETVLSFYENEFNMVNEYLQIDINHNKLICDLKRRGYTLVLASNPVFPPVAVQMRLSWVGLSIDDFDHITHYQNSSYCKPNLHYYEEIFKAVDKKPQQCLMIGNDILEDGCASQLGAQVYVVTDMLDGEFSAELTDIPHGSFSNVEAYISSLA